MFQTLSNYTYDIESAHAWQGLPDCTKGASSVRLIETAKNLLVSGKKESIHEFMSSKVDWVLFYCQQKLDITKKTDNMVVDTLVSMDAFITANPKMNCAVQQLVRPLTLLDNMITAGVVTNIDRLHPLYGMLVHEQLLFVVPSSARQNISCWEYVDAGHMTRDVVAALKKNTNIIIPNDIYDQYDSKRVEALKVMKTAQRLLKMPSLGFYFHSNGLLFLDFIINRDAQTKPPVILNMDTSLRMPSPLCMFSSTGESDLNFRNYIRHRLFKVLLHKNQKCQLHLVKGLDGVALYDFSKNYDFSKLYDPKNKASRYELRNEATMESNKAFSEDSTLVFQTDLTNAMEFSKFYLMLRFLPQHTVFWINEPMHLALSTEGVLDANKLIDAGVFVVCKPPMNHVLPITK